MALTLSDSFCVERHRDEWVALVDEAVDVLFGNADEVQMLYGCRFDEAVIRLRSTVGIAAITRSIGPGRPSSASRCQGAPRSTSSARGSVSSAQSASN